jgi:sodium transport system ATP-binding protein
MGCIVAAGLTKAFADTVAVADLDLDIQQGEIYGLLGPNGAGKTTTLRMLVGLMQPSAGSATISEHDVQQHPERAKAALVFLTGSTGLYERLSPRELLAYFGRLHGMSQNDLGRRVDDLREQFHLHQLMDRRCGTLSTGEKQRVSIARAMIHDPEVLILDEPTAGLDVVAGRFVADVLDGARSRGRAILLSTHYMAEAELLCDRVGLIHHGRLLRQSSPDQLREQMQARSLEEAFLRLINREQPS